MFASSKQSEFVLPFFETKVIHIKTKKKSAEKTT
jgi:hypothetical protein